MTDAVTISSPSSSGSPSQLTFVADRDENAEAFLPGFGPVWFARLLRRRKRP